MSRARKIIMGSPDARHSMKIFSALGSKYWANPSSPGSIPSRAASCFRRCISATPAAMSSLAFSGLSIHILHSWLFLLQELDGATDGAEVPISRRAISDLLEHHYLLNHEPPVHGRSVCDDLGMTVVALHLHGHIGTFPSSTILCQLHSAAAAAVIRWSFFSRSESAVLAAPPQRYMTKPTQSASVPRPKAV